jgi:hypothetical protein
VQGERLLLTALAGTQITHILDFMLLMPLGTQLANHWRAFALTTLSGRFVPAMAIVTAAVVPPLRGSFMSYNAALQQLSAGAASFVASLIVVTGANGEPDRFGAVGWLSMLATLVAVALAAHIDSAVAGSNVAP